MLTEEEIAGLSRCTDDRVFGYLTGLEIDAFTINGSEGDTIRTEQPKRHHCHLRNWCLLLCPDADLLIYADMARWASSFGCGGIRWTTSA